MSRLLEEAQAWAEATVDWCAGGWFICKSETVRFGPFGNERDALTELERRRRYYSRAEAQAVAA